MQKIVCQQCKSKFETRTIFNNHTNDQSTCVKSDAVTLPGITKQQEVQLRKRQRVSKDCSEEDKWNIMYGILFPGGGDSSPSFHSSESIRINVRYLEEPQD